MGSSCIKSVLNNNFEPVNSGDIIGRGQFYGVSSDFSRPLLKDKETIIKVNNVINDRFGQYDVSTGRFSLNKKDQSMKPRMLVTSSLKITLADDLFYSPYDLVAFSIWDMSTIERISIMEANVYAAYYEHKDWRSGAGEDIRSLITTRVESVFYFSRFLEVNPNSVIELSCTMLYPGFDHSRYTLATDKARVEWASVSIVDFSLESK